jgi:hypothetical protein
VSNPAKVSQVLDQICVETRWNEKDGLQMTDVRPLEELPALVDRIESNGWQLMGVSRYQE